MPSRRPRRAPPISRLTRAARIGLGVTLLGVFALRSGWAIFSRDRDRPRVPLAQVGPAPGGAPTEARSTASPSPSLSADPADGLPSGLDASARLVATARMDGRIAQSWLVRDPALGFDVPTVTIRAPGQATRSIAWSRLEPRAGSDVTGDGRADLVIERDTGGMGCCWSLWVYEVDPPSDADASASLAAAPVDGLTAADAEALGLRAALRLPLSRCRGGFEDVDGDSSLEVVTCDSSVPVALCPALDGADPKVVLGYVKGRGYVPARPPIAPISAAVAIAPADLCTALPNVLNALYAGRDAEGIAALANVPDAASVGRQIRALMAASPLYTVPGGAPNGGAAAVIVMDEAP